MPVNILPTYGQSAPQVQGGGGNGNLAGTTYQGAFGNSVQSIPGVGGALGGLLSSLYGSKYSVPNPTTTAGQAVQGNLGNLAGIYGLTVGADQASAAGAASQYNANLPDYQNMITTASGNISSELQGQVPADVQRLLQQQSAERGIATGSPGSPNSTADYLQALGLTSLGLEQQGQKDLTAAIGRTPTGPQFNPSTMFVTPEQEQAAQLAANKEAASPDPQAAGLLNTFGGALGGLF